MNITSARTWTLELTHKELQQITRALRAVADPSIDVRPSEREACRQLNIRINELNVKDLEQAIDVATGACAKAREITPIIDKEENDA